MANNLQAELMRDLQEVGMYEFAQDIGLIPELPQGAPHCSNDQRGRSEPGVLPASAFLRSPDPQQQQQQQQAHLQQQCQGSAPSTSQGTAAADVPSSAVAAEEAAELEKEARLINATADVAVARALQALNSARSRLRIHTASPTSSDPSREEAPSKRARRSSKGSASSAGDHGGGKNSNKGLRHFSVKVCEKVESKGRTTYNEVADELVAEMSKVDPSGYEVPYDEKNIRRRVYDAINVLMAMNIIQKEKKDIIWNGFPTGAGPLGLEALRQERQACMRKIDGQAAYLQELVEQQQALKQLLERNTDSSSSSVAGTALQLPFILVQAKPDAVVEVQISEDMLDVQFDFHNSPFQIHDDSYVLRVMLTAHQAEQARAAVAGPHRPGSRAASDGAGPSSSNGIARGAAP